MTQCGKLNYCYQCQEWIWPLVLPFLIIIVMTSPGYCVCGKSKSGSGRRSNWFLIILPLLLLPLLLLLLLLAPLSPPSPPLTPSSTLSFSSTSTYCSLWQCIHVPWCQNTCLRKKIPVFKDWPEWNFVFLVGKRKAAKVRVVCSLLSGGRKGGCKYCKLSKSECQTQCLQRKDCEQMISDWVVATAGIGDHL